jgi:hypothetical protein
VCNVQYATLHVRGSKALLGLGSLAKKLPLESFIVYQDIWELSTVDKMQARYEV